MDLRGRISISRLSRLLLLGLLGLSLVLWLSLGILLIVHADTPNGASGFTILVDNMDICFQCHRRVDIKIEKQVSNIIAPPMNAATQELSKFPR